MMFAREIGFSLCFVVTISMECIYVRDSDIEARRIDINKMEGMHHQYHFDTHSESCDAQARNAIQ